MRRRFLSVVLATALLGACSSGGTGSGGASCAATIEYDGHDYSGYAANVAPEDLGQMLGAARMPPCNETNNASEAGEAISTVEIKGVSPEVAVAVTYSNDVIFVRADYPFESLPDGVKRLLAQ